MKSKIFLSIALLLGVCWVLFYLLFNGASFVNVLLILVAILLAMSFITRDREV